VFADSTVILDITSRDPRRYRLAFPGLGLITP
jgi:hypothetical protein